MLSEPIQPDARNHACAALSRFLTPCFYHFVAVLQLLLGKFCKCRTNYVEYVKNSIVLLPFRGRSHSHLFTFCLLPPLGYVAGE